MHRRHRNRLRRPAAPAPPPAAWPGDDQHRHHPWRHTAKHCPRPLRGRPRPPHTPRRNVRRHPARTAR
ncbi:MAG: hypothetical protein CMO68_01090, partial [Verrucomicrobiales bacterium]|nr:hypothetical protein [Verrucomicrobiales bacterium]